MSIASDLVSLIMDIARSLTIPPVSQVYIPPPESYADKQATFFGLLALADGSTGLFFVRLGDTLARLNAEVAPQHLIGRQAIELASWFADSDAARKPLGLGAINAISQHVLRRTACRFDTARDSMGAGTFTAADHVGMVGFFPPLVERLRSRGIPLTVIEKKPQLVHTAEHFTVTLDPAALGTCSHILCTASTLLNDTLDDILSHCSSARYIAVIGPTAGCLPDPLFARGVDIVGGSVVKDPSTLLHRVHDNQPWGDAVEKYHLRKTTYPGVAALLERLETSPCYEQSE